MQAPFSIQRLVNLTLARVADNINNMPSENWILIRSLVAGRPSFFYAFFRLHLYQRKEFLEERTMLSRGIPPLKEANKEGTHDEA